MTSANYPHTAPPLLLDAMLGTLARRLRWLGYDAEYRADLPDEEMIRLAQENGRLLVTCDHALAQRCKALHLTATNLQTQVQQVIAAIGPANHPPRCTVCNGELVEISPQEASALVPPYVAQTQKHFVRCRRCGRVYWQGTHWPGLQRWRDESEGAGKA